MGLLDLLKHNKIKNPELMKDISHVEEEKLVALLDKVGDDEKEKIENQLRMVRIGLKGEENVRFELMHLKEPCLILHDITLFDNAGSQSQIDFIVLTAHCGFVLESKRLSGDIKIDAEGNFTRLLKNREGKVYKTEGIYSPIRQNEIHLDVLKKFLEDRKLIKYYPFESIVVISNDKSVVNKTFATQAIKEAIVKYDQLPVRIMQLVNRHMDMDISDSKMYEIAEAIIANDTPRVIDYVSSLGLHLVDKEIEEETTKALETGFIDDEETSEKLNDDSLLKALKKYRFEKAKQLNIQPYFIFNNAQLEGIINNMPKTKDELIKLQGFGEKKFETYGQDILDILSGKEVVVSPVKEKPTYTPKTESKPKAAHNEEALRNELKKYRFKKAQELNYQAYYIFNNNQMEEIIQKLPKNKEEFMSISGFAEKKYEMYGEDILKIIREN